jgi:hypothetical protein
MTSDEQNKSSLAFHSADSMVEQCYLNLPEDMVENNPLDLESSKKDKPMMRISCSLQVSTKIGTVARISTILKTYCVH